MNRFEGFTPISTTETDRLPSDQIATANWPIAAAAECYVHNRFLHLPEFVSPDLAQSLLETTLDMPSRRVICGDKGISWDEQNFDLGHPSYDFFAQPEAITFAKGLTHLDKISHLVCWTSGYSAGEFINPHKDVAGTIQLLICLQAPPNAAHGGELVVGGQRLFLAPGDAIAFEATTLEHYTTPLVASEQEPNPHRVVLVGRYYMS